MALATALLVAMLLNQRGIFIPDIKPEVYLNPWARLRLDLSTWHPSPSLGTQNYNLGLAPVDLLTGVMTSLGLSGELVARVLRWGLFVLAGAGSLAFYRRVAGDADSPAARVTVVYAYTLNPYSVVAGSTLAILLPYAVLPWLMTALRPALSTGRWRSAAVAALLFSLMSGMNVGAVPLLLLTAVPALLVWMVGTGQTTWRSSLGGLARTGVLAVGVALYWLIPAVAARGTATTVVDNSETLEAIASPSSWAEVLRGLGLWPMYGGSAEGPWQPGFVAYISSPVVVLATFLVVGAALLAAGMSNSRARYLGLLLVASVGLIMVGLHPPASPTIFGWAMRWSLENVPGLMALRTTNKAGAGLQLGLALLLGLGAHRWALSLHRPVARLGVTCLVVSVWVVATAPVWAGGWNVGRWDIPDYWRAAAADLNDPSAGRLWMIPGQVLAGYRWSTNSVDDVNASFFPDRSTVLRTALPTQNAQASNLLYHADRGLQGYSLPIDGVSGFARLLGAQQILVRNDVNWRIGQGLTPGLVTAQVERDPGLVRSGEYGALGESTQDAGITTPTLEAEVHPLQVYDVRDAREPVSALPVQGSVVLAGDAEGLEQARGAGLLPSDPVVRYATDVRGDQLTDLMGPLHRWVLTDTNRRTAVSGGSLQYGTSALLGAGEVPESTRALGSSWDQTVLAFQGIAGITSSKYAFDSHGIAGSPAMAVDDDPTTAWLTGAFGTAEGQWLEISFDGDVSLQTVHFRVQNGVGVSLDKLRVSFAGRMRELRVKPDGLASTDFRMERGDRLRIEIGQTSGAGTGYVGIADIALEGIEVVKGARLPSTLDLLAQQSGEDVAELANTPMDVSLHRAGASEWSGPEEETALYRVFSLPTKKTFRPYGVAHSVDPTLTVGRDGCVSIGSLGGESVRVRPDRPTSLKTAAAFLFNACSNLALSAGEHAFLSRDGLRVDSLTLRDVTGESVVTYPDFATATIVEQDLTSLAVHVENPGKQALWLTSGTALDPGWTATANGSDLGRPEVVNGYNMAWRLPAESSMDVFVTFRPQSVAETARAGSLAMLVVCLILAVRRPQGPRSARTPPASRLWPPAPRSVAVGVLAWSLLSGRGVTLAVGLVIAGLTAGRALSARGWYVLGLACATLAPFAWVLGNNARWGTVSGEVVLANEAPAWLMWTALTCVLIGSLTGDQRSDAPFVGARVSGSRSRLDGSAPDLGGHDAGADREPAQDDLVAVSIDGQSHREPARE